MATTREKAGSRWCIVVADESDPPLLGRIDGRFAPIQYRTLNAGAPLLQRALQRATSVAPASQVLVTAFEEFRERWEPLTWFVRPEHRFVCENRAASQLSTAAAILSIATESPSAIVTIIPARCYVAHEWVLKSALQRALSELPATREGVMTLGMCDSEESFDEDYLVVSTPSTGRGLRVDGFVRRPVAWIAAHLKREGALVASGLIVGYAGALAAHISAIWPGLSNRLVRLILAAKLAGAECEIPSDLLNGVRAALLQSLRWRPPTLPQRVLAVSRSGWSGLKSPRAVARVVLPYDQRPAAHDLGEAPFRHWNWYPEWYSTVVSPQAGWPGTRQ